MVYKEQFVAVVKCEGHILREVDGCVTLPFGREYSLLLKNLESRKANVKVEIDGQDVLYGNSLILDPNSEIELERFVENMQRGSRFKFIQKTEKIAAHRGDRIDDGMIRIEFAFEQKVVHEKREISETHYFYRDYDPFRRCPCVPWNPIVTWGGTGDAPSSRGMQSTYCCSSQVVANTPPEMTSNESMQGVDVQQDEGITVPGSQSEQTFCHGSIGILDPSSVIVLRLRGEFGKQPVKKPITVKTKMECPTCGTKCKSGTKFCPECGTGLY